MTQRYCSHCDTWIDKDEDGNSTPCGEFECPNGIVREDKDPTPLDFSVGHDDDWLFGEGDETDGQLPEQDR